MSKSGVPSGTSMPRPRSVIHFNRTGIGQQGQRAVQITPENVQTTGSSSGVDVASVTAIVTKLLKDYERDQQADNQPTNQSSGKCQRWPTVFRNLTIHFRPENRH